MKPTRTQNFIEKIRKLKKLHVDVTDIQKDDSIESLAKRSGISIEQLIDEGLNPKDKIWSTKVSIIQAYRSNAKGNNSKRKTVPTEQEKQELEALGISFEKQPSETQSFIEKIKKLVSLDVDVSCIKYNDTIESLASRSGISRQQLKNVGLNPDDNIGKTKSNISLTYRQDIRGQQHIRKVATDDEIRELQKLGVVFENLDPNIKSTKEVTFNGKNYGSITDFLEESGISRTTFYRRLRENNGDIYATLDFFQQNRRKRNKNPKIRKGNPDITLKQIKTGKKELEFEDALLILGLTPEEYQELLDKDIFSESDTIKEAREKIKKYNTANKDSSKNENGEPVLDSKTEQQLINAGINPGCIRYRIVHKGMTMEEAINDYCINGQNDPKYFKYVKNGVLLKHFLLKYKIDISRTLELMRNNYIPLKWVFQYVILEKLCNNNEEYFRILYDYFTKGEGEEIINDNSELSNICKEYKAIERNYNIINASYGLKTDILKNIPAKDMKKNLVDKLLEYKIENLSGKDIQYVINFYSDFNEAGVLAAPIDRGKTNSFFSEDILDKFRKIVNGVNIDLVKARVSKRYETGLDELEKKLVRSFEEQHH